MEYWQSYYANYPGYPPCPPPYPCPPHDQSSSGYPPLPPEYSLSGASHLRVSDTDSDLGSPSRGVRRNQVHTSASKYAATSCGYDCTVTVGKSAMAMPQSQSEDAEIEIPGDSESDYESNNQLPSVQNLSLQIINPKKKKEYSMVKIKPPKEYTLENIKEVIESYTSNGEFGYIEPGRGLKGKREWIFTEEDVKGMMEKHRKAREMRLWCYDDSEVGQSTRSKTITKSSTSHSPEHGPESKRPRTTKYDGYVKKLAKVDEIFKELDEKHHGKFTPEQLNAWSHLMQSGKHASLDIPPDMPFFRGKDKKKDRTPSSPPKTSSSSPSQSTSSVGVSPGRRVGLRTECIDQLKKWHALLVDGAITKAQYDDFQAKILNDMEKF